MGLLDNRRALITGVASDRSIATGIAEAFAREGAKLAFTYQGEKLKPRVVNLAAELGADPALVLPLDVSRDEEIDAVAKSLENAWGGVDIVIHAIGFAPRELLTGGFIENITREGFGVAHDISAYSFAALAKRLRPLLGKTIAGDGNATRGPASLLTLTYLGAERAMPSYNVMGPAKASLEASVRYMAAELGPSGTRVNAISAGPVKTLAAAGIKGFRSMLGHAAQASPLKRNVSIEDIGNTAVFLCSDWAAGITGEVLHVDAGYSIMGMTLPEGD